jgi:lysophospholipase L1-like esterase
MTGTGGSVGGSGGAGSGGISGAGGTVGSGGSSGSGGGGAAGSSSTGGTVAGGGGTSGGGSGGQSGGASGSAGTAGKGGAGGAGGAGGYNPCPTAAGTACIVLPLGDSITEGCCTAPYGGYRIELFRQALANRKSITFVGALTNGPDSVEGQSFPKRHEGHGGFTISGISGMITNNALTNYHPHIVLLMIGTNDINGNVDINNAPTRLGTLIDDITTRSPSSLVVVASIIPSRTDGTNQRFQAYNTSMRSLVQMRATAGKHVVFLDNYAAISKDSNYKTALLADNLHPNAAGYVILGQSFYGVIGGLLAAAP